MNHKNKEKRIDKEIFLLRNLPKEYKLGKKETQLGILLDVIKIQNNFILFIFLNLKSKIKFNQNFLLRFK